MLTSASVTTMLPVIDMARARAFYEGSLGLKPGGFKPDGKFVYSVGGSTLALFPKPEGTKADHTAISFQVTDIAASIAQLKKAGVRFEDYDFPGLKTVDHVCVLGAEKAAEEIRLAKLFARTARHRIVGNLKDMDKNRDADVTAVSDGVYGRLAYPFPFWE